MLCAVFANFSLTVCLTIFCVSLCASLQEWKEHLALEPSDALFDSKHTGRRSSDLKEQSIEDNSAAAAAEADLNVHEKEGRSCLNISMPSLSSAQDETAGPIKTLGFTPSSRCTPALLVISKFALSVLVFPDCVQSHSTFFLPHSSLSVCMQPKHQTNCALLC